MSRQFVQVEQFVHVHNANSLDVACRHFRCGVQHFEVSFDRLLFYVAW